MAHEPDDLGDARSRDQVRRFREQFHGGGSIDPDRSYEPSYFWGRWVPRRSSNETLWDFAMAGLGAVLLILLVAVLAGVYW